MIIKKLFSLLFCISAFSLFFSCSILDDRDAVSANAENSSILFSAEKFDLCQANHIRQRCTPFPSLGADGWASTNGGTTGGDEADASHTFIVHDRAGLVSALGDSAGNSVKKIIFVCGTIDLCVDDANKPLAESDFIATVNDVTYSLVDYLSAYDPVTWGRKAIPATDPQETTRKQSQLNQKARIVLPVSPNTSIIGLGHNARIINGNIMVRNVDNVVIRNIEFRDSYDFFPQWDPLDSYDSASDTGSRWNSQYDLISVESSTHVWIDHCTFNDGRRPDTSDPASLLFSQTYQHHDACIDVTKQSNYVTVSYNYFHDHDKVGLVGSSDTATAANGYGYLSVTYHHNLFKNVKQRMPRVRFGMVHVYNNLYISDPDDSGPYPFAYAFGIGKFARLYCENNFFIVPGASVSNLYSLMHNADSKITDSTYFYDAGSILNHVPVDIYADASATAISGGKEPILQTNTIWTPSSNYAYSLNEGYRMLPAVYLNAGSGWNFFRRN